MMKPALGCTMSLALLAGACSGSKQAAPDASSDLTRPPGVALCYSAAASTHPASVMFQAALAAGDRSMRAAAIDALEAAAKDLQDEEQIHLYLGLARLWRLAEPMTGDDANLVAEALGSRDHLKLAKQLCPSDARIGAWLGPLLVRLGRMLNDQPTVTEGLADLDEGIAAYPSFVLFSKLLVYADSPRDAPEFQNAFDAVVSNIDSCNHTPTDPACTNATIPHNREGAAIFLGDVYTKALRKDDALGMFTDAMAGPDYPTWSYQDVLTGRLADLDARIALYSNTDPSDDPPAAWGANNQCALCHTR
jgi:hypothetical protein